LGPTAHAWCNGKEPLEPLRGTSGYGSCAGSSAGSNGVDRFHPVWRAWFKPAQDAVNLPAGYAKAQVSILDDTGRIGFRR
jgi:hypothetical protein